MEIPEEHLVGKVYSYKTSSSAQKWNHKLSCSLCYHNGLTEDAFRAAAIATALRHALSERPRHEAEGPRSDKSASRELPKRIRVHVLRKRVYPERFLFKNLALAVPTISIVIRTQNCILL